MITFNQKSTISIALLSFVVGCCFSFLLMGGCSNTEKAAAELVTVEKLQKDLQDKENSYQAAISELRKKNLALQQELTSTQVELFAVKIKTKQKETTIKKLVQPKEKPGLPARELLKKVNGKIVAIDSSLSPCDSLAVAVLEYMDENSAKDSLYERQISLQDSIINVKDVEITARDSLYREVKTGFTLSLTQQKLLAGQNSSLHKQLRRQKRRNMFLSIGGIILSGLATNYFLNH